MAMASSTSCPFCHLTIPLMQLQRHANSHFDDDDKYRDQLSSPDNLSARISFLIGSQRRENFYRISDGLIFLLRKCLEQEPGTSTTYLCSYIDHFQSISSEDVGWGCGWRNIQMLASYLLSQSQDARDCLFYGAGFVPDIPSLQRWLEISWEKGFDTVGSRHFNQNIYGSKKWIGTTECAALFRSFGVRARVVDFSSEELERNTMGSLKGESHHILVDWVWNYFSNDTSVIYGHRRVIINNKSPLYFQHEGHSRTIIGVQVKSQPKGRQEFNLLIMDPAHKTIALETSLKENKGWEKLLKRGAHTLKEPQYQLCYVDPGIASCEEMEQLKTINSTLIKF